MIDWKRKRTILAVLLLGQCLDALTFVAFYVMAPPVAGPTERNGLIVAIMAVAGISGVAALKVGLGGVTFLVGTVRWPSIRLPRVLPEAVVAAWAATLLYRLALRNVLLVTAAGSGYLGATMNAIAVGKVV